MKFDWYQTTIEDKPLAVIEQVRKLGTEVRQADASARRWRYRQGWEVLNSSGLPVAMVMAGGNGEKPHALATSDAAVSFSELVREIWPDRHLVTRADAAEDFNEAGAYVRLRRVARRIAKAHRLAFPQYFDALDAKAGRTQYIGSPSSDYRCRIYEKGWEEYGKIVAKCRQAGFTEHAIANVKILNEETGELIEPENWTRSELQVRPKNEEARRLVATLTPEQCWGVTPWALELAQQAMALELERVLMRTHKRSKDEEAIRWMAQQYAAPLQRLQTKLGSPEAVGVEIMRLAESARIQK